MECPLCKNKEVTHFFEKKLWGLSYLKCSICTFIFMDPAKRLDPAKEKADYDLHQNDPSDEGYRIFLGQLVSELEPFLNPKGEYEKGLDYGCGPGPTLNLLLGEIGIDSEIYDPLYYNNPEVLSCKYDVVSCSEVVEHFYDPAGEFEKFKILVRPGGILAIMTDLFQEDRDFAAWHYVRERTHVAFYSKECFEWIARKNGWEILSCSSRVVILRG